ncbi:MAG TPA: helix-turn-helix transcriptional regulator [Vicinamibacterales bacterium]|jgi:PadR family transcriptional regulator PadR|nr:helix-turn-helix transcriptional regulator [Vicinamibacterales bacterium]
MKRKKGALVPLEIGILSALALARKDHVSETHGFQIAKLLQDGARARLLTAHGTLYRALGRLEQMGLLDSRWEDPHIAAADGRPVRRLYRLTDAGLSALARRRAETRAPLRRRQLARA